MTTIIKATVECVKIDAVIGPDGENHYTRLGLGTLDIPGEKEKHVNFAYRIDTDEEWDTICLAIARGESPKVEFFPSEIVVMRVHEEGPSPLERIFGGVGGVRTLEIPEGPEDPS